MVISTQEFLGVYIQDEKRKYDFTKFERIDMSIWRWNGLMPINL